MSEHDSELGLLLVGHGTASDVGTAQFLALARQLAERVAPAIVEPAFLELRQPDIAAGLARLIERGAVQLVTVPLLLFEAGHAKRDIPLAIKDALRSFFSRSAERPISNDWLARFAESQRSQAEQEGSASAFLTVSQAEPLGCHPAIVELSQLRYREALAGKPPVSPDKTALILVGRGSRDESATAHMDVFAEMRYHPDAAGTMQVCFLAMARPLLSDVLPQVATQGFRRVVVQPHLLFEGELADTVRRMASETQRQHPEQEWIVTPLLADPQDSPRGGNELLLRAIEDRFRAALAASRSA
jgi:sirohydrochlorin cobaltochelatase